MQTTGPYTPVAGTPITVYDPARYTAANVAVQVQNYSGLTLSCVISGYSYLVAPFTATTVPTYQAAQMTMNPAGTISPAAGDVALVWLQPGERSPITDGTLVPLGAAPEYIYTPAPQSLSLAFTPAPGDLFGATASPGVITLPPGSQSCTVTCVITASVAGSSVTFTGNVSGTVYLSFPIGGTNTAYEMVVNVTNATDTAINVTCSNGADDAWFTVGYPAPYASSASSGPLSTAVTSAQVAIQIVTPTTGVGVVLNAGFTILGSFNLDQPAGVYYIPLDVVNAADQAGIQAVGASLGGAWHFLSVRGAPA